MIQNFRHTVKKSRQNRAPKAFQKFFPVLPQEKSPFTTSATLLLETADNSGGRCLIVNFQKKDFVCFQYVFYLYHSVQKLNIYFYLSFTYLPWWVDGDFVKDTRRTLLLTKKGAGITEFEQNENLLGLAMNLKKK